MCDFLRQIDQAIQNYSIVKLAQFWRSFSLFTTSSLPRRNFVLHGSFLLKIHAYLPKLMYFQILLKDFVRNVHLEDVWANTEAPLLFTCFGGRRKCGIWWAIMPCFQGPARWECTSQNLFSGYIPDFYLVWILNSFALIPWNAISHIPFFGCFLCTLRLTPSPCRRVLSIWVSVDMFQALSPIVRPLVSAVVFLPGWRAILPGWRAICPAPWWGHPRAGHGHVFSYNIT